MERNSNIPPLNEPSSNSYNNQEPPKKLNNKWIYIGIIALLLVTNATLFFQKRKVDTLVVNTTNEKEQILSDKNTLQEEYNASLVRLDQLTTENEELGNQIGKRDRELAEIKSRIEQIFKKKNASDAELKEAQTLITKLNGKITSYEAQIAKLKGENAQLTTERDSLSSNNKSLTTTNKDLNETNTGLQKQVDLGKVLHASNIRVLGIDLRRGGAKEKEINKAKKVDLLRVVFDVDENKLTESGTHQLHLRITNPAGNLLSNAALGSGNFKQAETGEKMLYSISKTINFSTGQPVKNIQVDWQQNANYEKGAYKIEIYDKGYLIGKGTATLK